MISELRSDRYAMLLVVGGASIVWCGIVWVAATSIFG